MDEPQSPTQQHPPTEHVGADRPALPCSGTCQLSRGACVLCVCVCVCLMGLSQASLLVLLAQIELQSPPRRRPHSSAVSLFLPCVRPTVPLGPVVSDL